MNDRLVTALKHELAARGFATDGNAPNRTMGLADDYLVAVDLGDLFDTLVSRREKTFRSVDVVGADAARDAYDDVVAAIEAIKAIVSGLDLP